MNDTKKDLCLLNETYQKYVTEESAFGGCSFGSLGLTLTINRGKARVPFMISEFGGFWRNFMSRTIIELKINAHAYYYCSKHEKKVKRKNTPG